MENETDIPPLRRTRYIITIVLPPVNMLDDPLAQKAFLEAKLTRIKAELDPEKIGVIMIMDEGEPV